jgi:tetratricopeptide (TPR) repeat protein
VAYYERVLDDVREASNPAMVWVVLFFLGLYAHYLGDDVRAQACAQEILYINQELGEKYVQSWAQILLGYALTGLGQLDEARAAYKCVLDEVGWILGWLFWLQACLVRIALLRGETTALWEALPLVEKLLRYWEKYPTLRGVPFEPFETCWTCYRLLQALHDPRAPEVLERAYNLVQAQAGKLQDPEHRRMFLKNVAAHRDIVAEWERIQQDA